MSASLEARLERLSSIAEIRQLLTDYGRTLDDRDFKAYSLLFAENGGTWEGSFGKVEGPKAIEELMIKMFAHGTTMDRPNYHLMSSPDVEVDGDKARAWSRFTFIMDDEEGKPELVSAGEYNDTFVKENGRWRFKHRLVTGYKNPPPKR